MSTVPFKLDDHERASALWQKLEAHLRERLNMARLKNDGELSEVETARLRGQIFALKSLIALGRDSVVPSNSTDDHD